MVFRTTIVLATLLVAATVYAIPPVTAPAADVHDGKVMAVTEDSLMLMGAVNNNVESFAVTAQTKVIFNGNAATLMDVQMGDRATVRSQIVNDQLVALTITAFRPL
jgi:hypothetical protein